MRENEMHPALPTQYIGPPAWDIPDLYFAVVRRGGQLNVLAGGPHLTALAGKMLDRYVLREKYVHDGAVSLLNVPQKF